MRLLSLSLEHFRSYGTLEIKFEGEKNVSVLIGENATGKTNVLEAICVLSLLKSSRKAEDKDLIQWEKAHYRIRGVLENDAGSTVKLEVVSQMEPRKARAAFINDVKVPAMRYIGALPLITFTPDDLLLWSGRSSGVNGLDFKNALTRSSLIKRLSTWLTRRRKRSRLSSVMP